jgi:sarcosine oxidase subunit beta
VEAVASHATRIVPPLRNIRAVRFFAGLRPYTPDGKAFMGNVPGYENLYIAAGHEGDGIAYAPITGYTMAEYIMEGKTTVDIEPFSVGRNI